MVSTGCGQISQCVTFCNMQVLVCIQLSVRIKRARYVLVKEQKIKYKDL